MLHVDTPWVGLIGLVAMFVLPFLPSWLFEGPRKVRHWPQRHVCAVCGAPWVDGHACATVGEPLHGEIWRPGTEGALERRTRWLSKTDD
jgi:hypothetical protein